MTKLTNEEQQKESSPKSRLAEKLLETRTILIYGEIDQRMARDVTEKLLVLDADSRWIIDTKVRLDDDLGLVYEPKEEE